MQGAIALVKMRERMVDKETLVTRTLHNTIRNQYVSQLATSPLIHSTNDSRSSTASPPPCDQIWEQIGGTHSEAKTM